MRVLVVGDIRLFCEGLAYYLRRIPGVTVAGIARSSDDAVVKCRMNSAEIALVDMAMPGSMDAVRELNEAVPGTRIVGISVPDDGSAVIECAEAGVTAYVAREGSLYDLASTIGLVMRGEAPVSPRVGAALLRRLAESARGRTDAAGPPPSPLTQREGEIADLVREGLSNKQIARRLQIRLPTVKNHVHSILEKLDVRRREHVGERLAGAGATSTAMKTRWRRADPDPPMNPG